MLALVRAQQALVAEEAGVAVDQGLVGTGLDHLRLVRAEGVGSAGQDVDLHVLEDLERCLELRLTGGTDTVSGSRGGGRRGLSSGALCGVLCCVVVLCYDVLCCCIMVCCGVVLCCVVVLYYGVL